jgi:uncharacterized protein
MRTKANMFHVGIVAQMWLALACTAGGPQSDYESGLDLLHGRGGPKDQARAFVLIERAADGGHAAAQGALGAMLASGTGCAKDETRAVEVLGMASGAGEASAMFNLGVMRMKGQGCEPDVQGGLDLVTRAAKQGFAPAVVRLAEIYYFGEGEIPRDFGKALPWVSMAAADGNAWAQNTLGTMFEFGQGVETDRLRARSLYEQAALQGDARAQNNLANLLNSGLDGPPDSAAAYAWFSLAAPRLYAARHSLEILDVGLGEADKARGRALAEELRAKISAD